MNLKLACQQLFQKNRRQAGEFQYTVPSPNSYPYQWLWDSCFHAIILAHINPEDAKKELLALISRQFDNGMIPHMIYWKKKTIKDFPVIEWGKKNTSTITQPPMLAYAVFRIYQSDGDKNFLSRVYPSLKKFYDYILSDRDPRNHHLAGIINPDESGEDNSPRFDLPLSLPPRQSIKENFQKRVALIKKNTKCQFDAPFCMKNFFWVKDVPFNAILVENLKNLAQIASILGYEEDWGCYLNQTRLISQAMRKLMLEDGVFWPIYDPKNYKKIKVKTWAIFAPLFAGIATYQEADNLVENYLLNPGEFNLKFLVPTVSKSDPAFDPEGFWRGPIWMATNWFIFKGLKRYSFDEVAQKIAAHSLKLLKHSGFREQYHPLTGKGLGAKDFTWGGLVIDMG